MDRPELPRVKRHYSLVVHSADAVELRNGVWNAVSHTLVDESESGHLSRLVRRIDGNSDSKQIAASERVPIEDVEGLVDHLFDLGVLEYGAGSAIDYFAEYVTAQTGNGTAPANAPTPPIIIGDEIHLGAQVAMLLGSVDVAEDLAQVRRDLMRCARASFEDALAFEEMAMPFERWRGRFVVYISATVNPLELRGLNRVCLHLQVPAIAAAVDGPFLLVGPTMVPGRSACFECLDKRVLMNLREAASYQAYKQALLDGRVSGATRTLDGVIGGLLASLVSVEALNFSITGTTPTVGKILCLYLPTMEFTYNEILRVPGCPACGSVPERDDRELYFDIRATLANGS